MAVFALAALLVLAGGLTATPVEPREEDSDVGLNTVQLIEKHGYPSETHYVTTDDGYILTVHRIPYGIEGPGDAKRPAVLLMHGMVSSSADFVNMGPDRSIGYILADLGYDVWIGNARGNMWSRNHTTLDPDKDLEEFWDFSWHEIGYYDAAATIDHILGMNGDESLYYIGHSQGTTVFFVLTTTRPEYNDKIRVASLMAPAAIMEHAEGLDAILVNYMPEIEEALHEWGIYELPFNDLVREWGSENCGNPEEQDFCLGILFYVGGAPDEPEIDKALLPVIATNAPAGASIKQYLHYGQQIKAGGFSQYDYGAEENLKRYGTETPPPYDFSKITTPVAIYYGINDDVVSHLDVETVISKLPNVVNDYLVPYDLFNHIDFIYANDVVALVYDELIRVLQKY